MFSKTRLLVIAASAIAMGALPIGLDPLSGTITATQALAKNDGNGGGNGGGRGGSNGGANHGKSGSAAGKSAKSSSAGKSQTKATARSARKAAAKHQVAALAKGPPSKEKKLHAKLGRLNSLKRNVNAYLNSKSPRFAAVQAFVMASAQYDLALDAVEKAKAAVADAQTQLDTLNAELDALTGLTPGEIAAMTPEEQAALSDRIAELEAAVAAQETAVADAEAAVADAEAKADLAAVGTDDAALEAALLEMSNKPSADGTIDPEVLDWSKEVLGVGEAVGRIDEVRETLELKPG